MDPIIEKILQQHMPVPRTPMPPYALPEPGPAASAPLPTMGVPAMVGAGMLYPSSIGKDPGEDFYGMLNQQAANLRGMPGEEINPQEIAAMIASRSAPPSPAPEPEFYSAMVPEESETKTKVKYGKPRTSSYKSKSTPAKKSYDVDEIAGKYAAPAVPQGLPASSQFQQGVQQWSGQNPGMDFTEALLDELTNTGSPMRRGSLPKNKKKNPGLRVSP